VRIVKDHIAPSTGNVFWEARDVPVFCNVLCATRAEALAVPRGDLRLAYDPASGLIINRAFDPARVDYDVAYENSLHFSPRFQAYAQELAGELIERHDLRDKTVLEIACGQGDFLRLLCAGGDNRGIGFDPAHDPADAAHDPRIEFVREYYTPAHAERRADLVCCRHALEHIPDPVAFLKQLRATLADCDEVIVFFEVPNGLYTLRHQGIWDLIYEHCTYFVPDSLRWCFQRAGFVVEDVRATFDGQFLTLTARCAPAEIDAAPPQDVQLVDDVARFADLYHRKVAEWTARLADLRAASRTAVVWGSGSKGVTFLNIVRPGDAVPHVVDINPRKQGKFVAGTGQPIVAPEFLREHPADVVIVMNAIYLEEIRGQLARLGVDAEVVVA
jgi:SAM-dependent methyltransferase